jgi:cytochrome P450
LATNLGAQDKVYAELCAKLNGDADFQTNKTKDLPYFDAVIKESLRMYPSIAAVARNLQNDLQIGKYLVPKGANVMVSMLALHHNGNVSSE